MTEPAPRTQASVFSISLFLCLVGPVLDGCATVKPIRPPVFRHEELVRRFFERERVGHYPLTAQRGWNVQPSVTRSGAMFYTSNLEGSTDIWLRDLNNTVNLRLVAHDAEQHSPSVTPDGEWLVFVSEDRNPRGQLKLFRMPGGPGRIIKATLDGIILPNFWADTEDLSLHIHSAAQKLAPRCRPAASEHGPAWSPDGAFLYYVSDRCNPRQFDIWRVGMKKGRPVGLPQRLTTEGGDEPALSGNGRLLAYTARGQGMTRSIYVKDMTSGRVRRLFLPRGDPEAPTLYRSPSLDFEGRVLFYSAVLKDSNGNGVMDVRDASSVYRVDLTDEHVHPKRMLEGSFPIAGITFAPFLNGVVLYAAGLYNSVNIYLMRPEGIIPREDDIFEQYRFTHKYRSGHMERYFLSLDAVRTYWGHLPQYALYEGRLLLDRLRRLRGEPNRASDREAAMRAVQASARKNPFTALLTTMDTLEGAGRPTAHVVQAFVNAFASRHARSYAPAVAREVLAASLETLGLAYMSERNVRMAHRTVLRLVTDHPDYSRAVYSRFLLARIELRMRGVVPPVLIELGAQFDTLPPRMREGISAVAYNAFYSSFVPKQSLKRVDIELLRTDLPPVLRTSLTLARARLLYDLDRFEESIAVAGAVVGQVPPRSGSFVRAWQSIAFASEKLGRYADAYEAKLRYGGAYSEETGAQVTEGEYLEVIEEAERQIDAYVRTARSLSAAVADADLGRGNVSRVLKLDGQVKAGGLDREMVREFCRKDSQAWRLLTVLGRNAARYLSFCSKAPTVFRGSAPIEADAVRTAVDLLYIGAYGAAARLNIMFLHMRSVDLFPDLYRKRAIYYHRLKVDLAIEHSGRKLEWEEHRIKLLDTGDLQSVLELGDPFDSSAFDALADGYKFSLQEALRFDDMSLLYGYAYTLVRKSVQREDFYDRLGRGPLPIRPERLADYKASVLRDLKTAEYYLRYIIYRRPNEADSYLLLGWLQQYIDDRRASSIVVPDTFLTGLVQYVTGTKSATPTDGRLFKDLYDGFFRERLYEANIELYRQALERTKASPVDQANLNLNLANNYFKLLNFKNAVEHYNLAAAQMRHTDRPIFRDYVQEALFYYNRGRALFYQGFSGEATADFDRAYRLYDENERKPLFEEFSRLRYEKLSFRISGSKDSYNLLLEKEKLLLEKVQRVNFKMALASAMLGLAEWESGKYTRAVDAYEDAENRLYGGAEPPPNAVKRSNLRNFMAMALQDQNRFGAADRSAAAAADYASKEGLSANLERYQPESIISRFLGCLLNYGEDFSVIGEGRNPFGFSPLRSYELSLGIRLENRILQGDLRGAETLLEERRSFFKSRDSAARQGRLALLVGANTRAYHHYQAGRLLEAYRLFGSAAQEATSLGFPRETQLNFRNRTQVLFDALDRRLLTPADGLERLKTVAAELQSLRSSYAQRARLDYAKKQKPGFEFTPVHEAILEQAVRRDLSPIVALQGMCHYYTGLLLEELATAAPELAPARAQFSLAITVLEGVSAAAGDGRPEGVRAELNMARAEFRLGRLHAARARLRRAYERAFEFGMVREEWAALESLAQVTSELAGIRPQAEFRAESLEHTRAAVLLLRRQPHLFFEWLPRVTAFYDYAASLFIEAGLDREALQVLEQKHQHQMQSEYLRYPLRFSDEALDTAYRRYRNGILTGVRLREREMALRSSRADFDRVKSEIEANHAALAREKQSVLARAPGHAPFFGFELTEKPVLGKGTLLFRLFRYGDTLHVWLFENGQSDFVSVHGQSLSAAFVEALARFRHPTQQIGEVLVLADAQTFRLPLKELLRQYDPRWPAPVYLTRLPAAAEIAFVDTRSEASSANAPRLNVRAVVRLDSAKDYETYADVVSAQVPRGQGIFPVPVPGRMNLREWFKRTRPASVVLLHGEIDYARAAGLYEALRANGASSVVISRKPGTDAAGITRLAGRLPYTGAGGFVFGSAGYLGDAVLRRAGNIARTRIADGDTARKEGRVEAALELYSEAVSLADVSRDRSLQLEARLRAAERRTLNSEGKQGRLDFDELLRDFGQLPNNSARIHRVLLGAYYRTNRVSIAEEYLRRLKGKQPSVAREVGRAAHLLSFVNRLGQLRYQGDRGRFSQEYRGVLEELARSREARAAVLALARRTLYGRAVGLASAVERRGDTSARHWIFVASREAALLGQQAPFPPAPGGLSGDALLLSLAERSSWKEYSDVIKQRETEPGTSFALIKFRRRLYTEWQKHSRERIISIQDIADVPVDVGVSAYQRISSLERCMVFAMLLRATDYDAELQTAQNLRSLIKVERRISYERTSRMALLSARRFLAIADPLSASAFLLDYEQYSRLGLAEAEQPQLAARTGVALEAAGLQRMVTTKQGRKKLNEYRMSWAKELASGRGAKLAAVYFAIPKKFTDAEVVLFNRKLEEAARDGGRLAREWRIVGSLLKKRAVDARNWTAAFDSALFARRALLLSAEEHGRSRPAPQYMRTAAKLRSVLPAGQSFTAMVDTNFRALRLRLEGGGGQWTADELAFPGRYLRGRLLSYLEARRLGTDGRGFYRELAPAYRSLFPAGGSGIRYFWFEGVHAFAPIPLERGDRIYQVLDPDIFAREPSFAPPSSYASGFRVRTVGEPHGAREGRWAARQQSMEVIAIGEQGSGAVSPLHVLSPIIVPLASSITRLRRDVPSGDRSYFISGNRLYQNIRGEVADMAFLMGELARLFRAPGILVLRKPAELAHPYFVRFFYDRSFPAAEIDKRYVEAALRLRRVVPDESAAYGYRLVTSRILHEPQSK